MLAEKGDFLFSVMDWIPMQAEICMYVCVK